jgi:hypothetical protein
VRWWKGLLIPVITYYIGIRVTAGNEFRPRVVAAGVGLWMVIARAVAFVS